MPAPKSSRSNVPEWATRGALSYSLDASDWIDMLTVTKTSDDDQTQQFPLPPATSGTLWVRATDTDQTPGNSTLDSLFLDYLAILTENPLPEVSIVATDPSAAEEHLDPGAFTLSRTGDAAGQLTVGYSVAGTAANGTDLPVIEARRDHRR